MEKNYYEVLIVGAGISGASLAYELARYTDVESIAVLEKYEDVATLNTSGKANSQTIHFGDIETNYTLSKASITKQTAKMVEKYCLQHKLENTVMFSHQKMALGVGDKEVEFMLFVEVLADRIGGKINRQELSSICRISDETVQNYLYILNKSFHISFVRPFWRSKTSELRKMQKLYFQDNGLRNAIMHDFSPLFFRNDKGELVENLVYNMLRKHYSIDQIQYWNTRDQNEVDFILKKQIALEVKYNGNSIKNSKYKLFRKIYPEIDLYFACLENIGEYVPLMSI